MTLCKVSLTTLLHSGVAVMTTLAELPTNPTYINLYSAWTFPITLHCTLMYSFESTAYKLLVTKTSDMKDYMKRLPAPVPITGGAGTAAIFHCNLLHASGHNLSAEDRWQIFFCFNQCKNRPADLENPRPDYVRSRNWTPLTVGSEDGVIAAGRELAA